MLAKGVLGSHWLLLLPNVCGGIKDNVDSSSELNSLPRQYLYHLIYFMA